MGRLQFLCIHFSLFSLLVSVISSSFMSFKLTITDIIHHVTVVDGSVALRFWRFSLVFLLFPFWSLSVTLVKNN